MHYCYVIEEKSQTDKLVNQRFLWINVINIEKSYLFNIHDSYIIHQIPPLLDALITDLNNLLCGLE